MKSLTIFLSLALLLGFESVESYAGNLLAPSPTDAIQTNLHSDPTGSRQLILKPFLLDIVPPSSGIQFYRNGIIFLSHAMVDEKVPEKHLSFGTLKTFMTLVQDSLPGTFMPFLTSSDLVFPSEATTFSEDYNTMYLSLIPPMAGKEQIFKAAYKSSTWDVEEKPLSFCDENFIFTHPSISTDASFMVFSSDLTGTAGGLDLYISKKEGEAWGDPENLGRHINSTGNELFACLDSQNNLYFSSDGLPGEGGYDIFVCRYNGTGWEKPNNLSGTINTTYDEVAFTVNRSDNRTAFYTSRKKNGKSKCDLISVTINPSNLSAEESGLSNNLMALAVATEPVSATTAVQPASPTTTVQPGSATATVKPVSAKKAVLPASQSVTVTEPVKPVSSTKPAEPIAAARTPEPNRPAAATTKEPLAAQPKPEAPKPEVPKPEAAKPEAAKPEAAKPVAAAKQDAVVYRVQILANMKPIGSKNITVAGTTYKSFEYLYKGGYRTTVGDLGTLAEALKLQNICRKNGYEQAFVVAFRNNVRDTDPALFK